ncbi:MAG: hypothetical protein NDJ75_07850 [Thermoanaerobaculia bacterium]|nr:hypothetical protein [Thermoanaerobaculia bacterium]
MAPVPARLRPWLRVALWTAAALALFELAWLGLFEWAERSGRLREWANRRPEKVRLEFAAASSIWPGLIEIDHLLVRGRTERGVDWQVEAESARLQIALLPLAGRRLIVRGAEVRGLEVRTLRPAADDEASRRRAASRGLQAMTAAPATATAARGGGPAPRRPRSRWTFEFHRLRVEDVRAVVLDDSELAGKLHGEIGFAVRSASGEGELFPSTLAVDDLSIRHQGAEVARELTGTVELGLSPYRYREERGRALLPHANGRVQLKGLLDDRPILAELLRRAPWIDVEAGIAPFAADLRFRRGHLLTGSRLEAPRAGQRVAALDFTITGPNALSLVVDRDDGVDRARWELRFERFTLHRATIAEPLLVGSGLAVAGIARPAELATLAEKTELRLELGEARLPDLGFLAAWLPKGAQLQRLGGSAVVSGHLSAEAGALRPTGAVAARFDRLDLRWADLDFAGRAELDLAVAGGDLAERRLELAGTRLLLADFATPSLRKPGEAAPANWWMQLRVDEGEVRLGPPFAVSSRFQTRLRDTAPLVALFETRRDLPRWAERLLTEEDVRATGSLRAGPRTLDLERIDTELLGGKLSMRMRFAGVERRGRLLLAWRRLALGAGFDGEARELRFHDAREWFEAGL